MQTASVYLEDRIRALEEKSEAAGMSTTTRCSIPWNLNLKDYVSD